MSLRFGHVNAQCRKCGSLRAKIYRLPRFFKLTVAVLNAASRRPLGDNIHTHTSACHKVSRGVSKTVTMTSPKVASGLLLIMFVDVFRAAYTLN
jgi:hypothetical protein